MFVRTYSLTVTPAHCWLCRCVWRPELCYDRLSFSLPFSISCPLSSSLWWCVNWPQRHDPLSRIPRAIRQLFELRLENLSSWGSWHPSELSKKQFLVVMLDLAWDKEIFGCIIFFFNTWSYQIYSHCQQLFNRRHNKWLGKDFWPTYVNHDNLLIITKTKFFLVLFLSAK